MILNSQKYRISGHSVHRQQGQTPDHLLQKNQLTVKTIYIRNRHTRFHLKKVSRIVRHSELRSTFEESRKYSRDLIKRIVEKGYNESTVRKQNERVEVDHLDQ